MADMTRLANILRAAGLTVVEIPGWKTRGRPGSFSPTRVLCHHTAGAGNGLRDATSMFTNGRPDLKPPLCQLALDRQGVWYVGAAGRANHAGRCKPIRGLNAYGDGRPYGDGNAQMVGVEAQNDGREPWPAAQYDSYVHSVAAITEAFSWAEPLGHKETSVEGKPDPHFDMDKFRRDVAAINPQEDDMPSAAEVADEILKRPVYDSAGNKLDVGRAIGITLRNSTRAAIDATVARNLAEASAKAAAPLSDEDVQRIAEAAAREVGEGFTVEGAIVPKDGAQ